MNNFGFFNDINKLQKLDGDLESKIKPKWQRKQENNKNLSNLNNSTANHSNFSFSFANNSFATSGVNNTTINQTPSKAKAGENRNKNEKKSPAGRKTPTPIKTIPAGGDRFIPNRGATNFEISNYKIKKEEQKNDDDNNPKNSEDQMKALSEAITGMDINEKRILAFQNKAPAPPESHINPLRVMYSTKTPSSSKGSSRYIPTNPERILDAPDIVNDYYLNLLDWSSSNIVTVALGQSVYLWNAGTGNIEILFESQGSEQACSLAWVQEGSTLAVGTASGTVELWDCVKMKRLRVMAGHSQRVGALAWNAHLLSSGSRDGSIIHHDVRQREHNIATLNGHTQEVCGLKWSTDAKYLASGGNDNLVNIWSSTGGATLNTSTEPLHVFNQHQAAVRALAWCPWQPHVLASGGGTADRCIKFWNVNTGICTNSVDTHSQVCSLLFSETYKEIISAHGYANNQLTVWKYPSMIKQIDLTGHSQRVLQMALSPDGSTVMSAGADETLRLWKCFAPDPTASKKKIINNENKSFLLKQSIR